MSTHTKQIQIVEKAAGKVLEVAVTGKLSREDYLEFVPVVEEQIKNHGKIRILVILNDFDGWSVGATWEDIKFDAKHFNDIEKLALVGDKAWEKGMAVFCRPFTTADVRYFDLDNLQKAREWIGAN